MWNALVLLGGAVLAEERFMEQHLGRIWREYADRVPRYGGPGGLFKTGCRP